MADALTAHGFAAHTDSRNNQLRIVNNHCPFGDVAIEHPVICAVDRGMVKGMLAALYGETEPNTEARSPGATRSASPRSDGLDAHDACVSAGGEGTGPCDHGVEQLQDLRRAVGDSGPLPADGGLVPRAIGPVKASRPPSVAQFSTAARTSGTRIERGAPVVASRRSAASSSVTRKFDAIDAAA